ncbi:transposase [Rubrivirga sp. S365]|uniref:Transposase n=1 Tax=Rubrivirga litoralis TaxID=3075598 RepID=A0ABU3BV09_9BACT|nr:MULTISPECIES: transposase [unclassified Rubrivirga]MDT0633112.1 transposase [Rubrivirga sp. F394]MDT7857744.1 transposase [Rubrivirga sp. S365]
MAAFSLDLRRRVLGAALADGAPTEHALAERFGVSRGFVQKLKRRWRTDGTAEPVGHRGGAPRKLSDDDRAALVAWADGSDATCAELRDRLAAERGVGVARSTVNGVLVAAGLTLKKRRSEPTSATART